MSETLNDSSELNSNGEVWGELASVEYAGDAVDEEAPEESPERIEQQKPVGELTPQETAQEYCDLLLELSDGFESAEGKTSRNATYSDNGELVVFHPESAYDGDRNRVVAKLWETRTGERYSGRHNYSVGEIGSDGIAHFEDPYLDREWSMELADKIIHAESDWRKAGENTTIEDEDALHVVGERNRKELEDFEDGALGGVRKTFMPDKHRRLTEAARESATTPAERATLDADQRLQRALEEAYSLDYGNGHHRISFEHSRDPEYQERTNEEYNNKFFSPENKATIDRAIELRRRLESEGEL